MKVLVVKSCRSRLNGPLHEVPSRLTLFISYSLAHCPSTALHGIDFYDGAAASLFLTTRPTFITYFFLHYWDTFACMFRSYRPICKYVYVSHPGRGSGEHSIYE